MPAILTTKYKTFLARQLYLGLANNVWTSYLFLGTPDEWEDSSNVAVSDSNPPIPVDSTKNVDYDYYRDIIAAKRVTTEDVAFVVPRVNWESGTVYDQYDDQEDLSDAVYYVLDTTSLPYKVYKCLWNNAGIQSTIAPSVVGTALTPTSTADGYVWQYMYTITTDDYKFLTTNWMPVLSNSSVVTNANTYAGRLPTAVPLVVEEPGSNYSAVSITTVEIIGDGSNAAVSNTGVLIAGGEVASVILSSGGSGYTQVTSINVYQSGATAATVRAIIPPYPNHGHDPIKELGAGALMFATQFTLDESGSVTTNNNFRRIGLLINPVSPNGNLATADVLTFTTDITFTSNTGVFAPDDILTNATKSTHPTAQVVDVVDGTSNNYVVRVVSVNSKGESIPFEANDTITCLTSGVEATVVEVADATLKPFSGDILYVHHRTPVTRHEDQSEDVKLILPFRR